MIASNNAVIISLSIMLFCFAFMYLITNFTSIIILIENNNVHIFQDIISIWYLVRIIITSSLSIAFIIGHIMYLKSLIAFKIYKYFIMILFNFLLIFHIILNTYGSIIYFGNTCRMLILCNLMLIVLVIDWTYFIGILLFAPHIYFYFNSV